MTVQVAPGTEIIQVGSGPDGSGSTPDSYIIGPPDLSEPSSPTPTPTITEYLRINTPVDFGNVFPGEVVTEANAFSVHFSASALTKYCVDVVEPTPVATPTPTPVPTPTPLPTPDCTSTPLIVQYQVTASNDLAPYLSMVLTAVEIAAGVGTDESETYLAACLDSGLGDTVDAWDVTLDLSDPTLPGFDTALGSKTGTITIAVTTVGSCSL